ncbi:uncharacterized protein LOC130946223 [Arachis stenosperma]|uniref:uncharacterized protein LOC130946223 n=1 Tax=Arachis stenosperma TaxID=217475 RepID=UPI0025ACBAFD|nr:uncharacterized protein LOC130946223 [Arachis stenosperma]
MSGSSSSSPSIKSYRGISGASTIEHNPDTSKYTIRFGGTAIETTVTDKSTVVDQWVEDMNALYATNSSIVVGIDIERCAIRNKSATLNLCIDKKCLVVQLFYIDNLPKLALERYSHWWPSWADPPSLKDLANDLVRLSMKKPKLVSLSNWGARVLSIEQVEYACVDAHVSYQIGHKLLRDD